MQRLFKTISEASRKARKAKEWAMAFKHGVYTSELPTEHPPGPFPVDSNVVFAVGTAAVDRLEAGQAPLREPAAHVLFV